jgi:hypothetical protein
VLGPAQDRCFIERVAAISKLLHLATDILAFDKIVRVQCMTAKTTIQFWAKRFISDNSGERYHSFVQIVDNDGASPNVWYLGHAAGERNADPVSAFE